MKKCSKCNLEKTYEAFCKTKKNKDGYTGVCKECKSKQDREKQEERDFYKQFEIC